MPYLHSAHAARPLGHCFTVQMDTVDRQVQFCMFYASSLSLSMARIDLGQTRLFQVIEGLDCARGPTQQLP